MIVSDIGSRWNSSSTLRVGDAGIGSLTIERSGLVSNAEARIGDDSGSRGTASIEGLGSTWLSSGDLYVAQTEIGVLTVRDGGRTFADIGYIGRANGSSGTATVADHGSLLSLSRMVIGGSTTTAATTAEGALHVANGATVVIDGDLRLWNPDNLVELQASTLQANSVNNGGRIELSGGTAGTARLLVSGTVTNTGVLAGDGVVSGTVSNSGEVRADTGDRLVFDGTVTNTGAMNVIGGEVEFDDPFTNASAGMISARNATFRFNGGLKNQGDVAFSFGNTDVFGDVTIPNAAGAQFVISGNNTATLFDDVSVTGAGELRVSVGSTAVIFSNLSGTGTITGQGTTIIEEGDLKPGSSPGSLAISGDLILRDAARVELEIEGTVPGTTYDTIEVAGPVTYGGTADIVPLAPYTDLNVRGQADEFALITSTSRSDTFGLDRLRRHSAGC